MRTVLDEHEAMDERERSKRIRLTVPEYVQETRRLQELIPLGRTMPPDTHAFVVSPDMHETVLAAALTVAPTDVRTLDPELDPPARSGVLLLPAPLRIGDGTNYARVSVLAWRPAEVRLGIGVTPWPSRHMADEQLGSLLEQTWSRSPEDADNEQAEISRDHEVGVPSVVLERQSITVRYLFAFWRLCAQPIIEEASLPTRTARAPVGATGTASSRVRVVQLRHPAVSGAGTSSLRSAWTPVRRTKWRRNLTMLAGTGVLAGTELDDRQTRARHTAQR